MSYREHNDLSLDLDVYGEGEEATSRLGSSADVELEYYDEEDIATVPWIRRLS